MSAPEKYVNVEAVRRIAASVGRMAFAGRRTKLVLAGAGVIAVGLGFGWSYRAGLIGSPRRPAGNSLQCAHYATQRVCELVGVPVSERQVAALIKPKASGHSLAQIEAALTKLGLTTVALSEDWAALVSGKFPCIVHLRDPEHFVVLARTDQDRVILFDDMGRRRVAAADTIRQRWSGAVLRVARPSPAPPSAADPTKSPHAEFDTLIADAGELRHDTEEVEFKFPVTNRGSAPLQIAKVDVSCKCLSVTRPETIEPGKRGVIKLKYSPKSGGSGPLVFQEALVATNDPRLPRVRLTALASLETRVVIYPMELVFPKLRSDEVARRYVTISYRGEHPEQLNVAPVGEIPVGVSCRIVSYEEVVRAVGATGMFAKPGDLTRKRFVELTVDGAAVRQSRGRFRGEVRFQTGISSVGGLSVSYSGSIVPPVEARPRLIAFHHDKFGDGASAVAAVHLHSKEKYDVKTVSEGAFSARPVERGPGRSGHEIVLRVSLPAARARELNSQPFAITVVNPATGREAVLELTAYHVAPE